MRKSKRALALIMALTMSTALFACGKDDKKAPTEESKEPAATTEASKDAKPASTEKFYVYSWNTELQDRLKYFKEAYPDDFARIQYVNIGDSTIYQEKIDGLLGQPDAKEYPDLMATEADYIKKYVNSDQTLAVTDLGITEDDMKNMYDYTLTIPTDQRNNSVKGLSWQAAPGSMMYRTDLAKTLLGVDSPEAMQEKVKDWDSFIKTAEEVNEKSGGKTKMLSGPDDVQRAFLGNKENAWVGSDQKFVIDQKVLDYMDTYKKLVEEKLTNGTEQWTEQWNANCANDSTLAYFGCTWFLHWTIKDKCGGKKVGEGTYGKWNLCQGPSNYYWGGTWLCATAKCSDPELAGKIMKTLCCDTDTMYNIAADTLDYVNNKEAVQKLIDAKKGSYDFLGGQDFLAIFAPLAEKVDVSWMSAYDQKINDALNNQNKAYANGKKTKDEAIAALKKAVKADYPAVTVE